MHFCSLESDNLCSQWCKQSIFLTKNRNNWYAREL